MLLGVSCPSIALISPTGIRPSYSILHQRKFFATVTPVNFNTIATPHIGLVRYPSPVSIMGFIFGPKIFSRTGEQIYGADKWSKTGRPLLEVMADPGKGRVLGRYRPQVADGQPRTRVH
jgi:hypothetical protein